MLLFIYEGIIEVKKGPLSVRVFIALPLDIIVTQDLGCPQFRGESSPHSYRNLVILMFNSLLV